MSKLMCFARGRHEPRRHPLGAWRCEDCGVGLADLAEAGLLDSSHVPIIRRVYQRGKAGGTTRTDAWAAGRRGW